MRICPACGENRHDACENLDGNAGAVDALEFVLFCGCECPETSVSYACAEWLHNCPGCACSCHGDPAAREIWNEAFRRFTAAEIEKRDAPKADAIRIEYSGRRRRIVLEERPRV